MAARGQAACCTSHESDLDWMSEGEDSADPDLSESGECQAPAGVVSDIPCPDTDKDIRFDRLVAVVVLY